MKKIKTYLWEHKFAYLFAFAAMVISVSLDMLSPQLTRHIIDDVIVGGRRELLSYLLIGILCVGVGRCIFQYAKEYVFDLTASDIGSEIRRNLFDHIQSLSADFFDKANTGELMARVMEDVNRIWDGLGFVGMLLLEVGVHTSIILFCMFNLNWKLALLPTAAMLSAAYIAVTMERKLDPVYEAISEENATLNTVAEENLEGVRTVKAFAREKFEIGKFLSHNKKYYELNMRQSRVFVKYSPYLTFITKLLPLTVLLTGGYMVIKGELSLGSLGAFVEYSTNIVWPMEMLGWLSNSFSSARASNRKLEKLYSFHPTITEPKAPVHKEPIRGKVEFDHVSFRKEDGHAILQDISFCIEPGQTLGIMGATGSGKTSLVYLLQRLYDVSEGAIRVDGVNVKELPLKQLRGNISLVMQDVFLFSDTISENVKLGKKGYTDSSAIRQASEDAQARSFIERLEKQYDTVIGERGVGLSGGQKQRISIARALSKKNPILVLDDSTSALDMETENQIQQALARQEGVTKLIIAHRISAVKNADEIIFLKDGRIRERGTHESLLAAKGLYYETYLAQYGEFLRDRQIIGI